jgi:starch-binding outer membrane protein, SusD/RagB family
VDLLFRERAFWMFSTGHRMGDLRRLLRQYGRAEHKTYPTGPHKAGVNYGNDVVFVLMLSEQANPAGRACLDRNP